MLNFWVQIYHFQKWSPFIEFSHPVCNCGFRSNDQMWLLHFRVFSQVRNYWYSLNGFSHSLEKIKWKISKPNLIVRNFFYLPYHLLECHSHRVGTGRSSTSNYRSDGAGGRSLLTGFSANHKSWTLLLRNHHSIKPLTFCLVNHVHLFWRVIVFSLSLCSFCLFLCFKR